MIQKDFVFLLKNEELIDWIDQLGLQYKCQKCTGDSVSDSLVNCVS